MVSSNLCMPITRVNTGFVQGVQGVQGCACAHVNNVFFPRFLISVPRKYFSHARISTLHTLHTLHMPRRGAAFQRAGFFINHEQPCTKEKMSKKPMRESMPLISEWIDDMRAAFGREEVEGQIRRGMKGEPVFYASENGVEVGTRTLRGQQVGIDPATGNVVAWDERAEQ